MSKNDGGPAFPVPSGNLTPNGRVIASAGSGMSLRDWFAGMALMGTYSCQDIEFGGKANIAKFCYQQADAMLEERNKP